MAAINLERIGQVVERFMLDTITISRRTGETYNEITMAVVPTFIVIYTGPGFVAPMGDPAGTTLAALNVQRIQYEIGIPRTAPAIEPNDIIQVDVSADPSLVAAGARLYVHDEIPSTFLTHRRLKAFKDESAV